MAAYSTLYRFLTRIRIGFFTLIAVILLTSPIHAQETVSADNFDDPYLVKNIEADATAGNAVAAREEAFKAAQIRGYEELAKRFLSEEDLANFETPDIETVSLYVEDFEVTDEKLSATRYKGTYNIRYADNTFRKPNMDGFDGEQVVMPQTTELLVLPFMEVNGRHYLWQINPFWEAWKRAQSKKVLGKIVVPMGSRDDVMSIRDGQNLSYDPASLNGMRIRYQANQVAIAVARPEPMSDNTMNIAIGLYEPKPYGPQLSKQLSVRGYPGEMMEQLYNRVVATITQALHADWERNSAVDQQMAAQQRPTFSVTNNIYQTPVETVPSRPAPTLSGEQNNILAQLQFSSPRQWVETKKAIEAISGIDKVQIKSLSSRSATVGIDFLGSVDNLRVALNQQGVRLNEAPTGAIYQLMPIRQ